MSEHQTTGNVFIDALQRGKCETCGASPCAHYVQDYRFAGTEIDPNAAVGKSPKYDFEGIPPRMYCEAHQYTGEIDPRTQKPERIKPICINLDEEIEAAKKAARDAGF